MSSILNKILPSLKSRLIIAIALAFIILTALTLTITYFSMSKSLDARILSQLENRFYALEEEYKEELYEDNERYPISRRERKAQNELLEKIEDIQAVLKNNNEWIYLISEDNKQIISSSNAPAYKDLSITKGDRQNKSVFDKEEFIYSYFLLTDDKFLLLTANLKEKNAYMTLYRNRFIYISIVITLVAVLTCYFIIHSSLKGFEEVRKTADSIAIGDYSHRVEVGKSAPKEVIELSYSFNNMIERTQTLLKEIKDVSNNVAHDLRTPLTRIRGKIETTLMSDADLLEHKELSGIVIEECDKLMLLINNMLTLAEYESGLVNKKTETIDLKKLLKNLCEVFESVCEDKDLTIALNTCDEDLIIQGDTEKIQRSLSNLFDNAIKYSDEGGRISISGKITNDKAEISIADSGCGISEEDQVRIFERFYRVESSRSTPGNGLGLNLAKAFIENHGGKLSVISSLGKGSTFKVSLTAAS